MHVEPVANWLVLQAYKTVNPLHLLVNYITDSRGTPASASESLGTGGSVALDIKAINLVEQSDLDFQNSEHWTVFAVSLGHRSEETTDIVTTVLFRQGPSPCDELDLILRTAEWICERKPAEIITYNGEQYDIPILKHRGSISSHECPGSHQAGLSLLFDAVTHTDLFSTLKKENGDEKVSLDDALANHGINAPEVRLNGEYVTGGDMPRLGMRILNGEASTEEYQAVVTYAESDVEPLFALHDSVSETRDP
jgi:hypothetical protein